MIPTPEQLTTWRKRPYSWSQHSSFKWNPEQWFNKYILGTKEVTTPELAFGKVFADSCELRTPLAPVTMLSRMEQDFSVKFDDMTLTGFMDTFDDASLRSIGEYKTGMKPWTQKRVDEHGQLDFYCLLNFIQNKVRPEDTTLFLEWVQTERKHIIERDGFGFDYQMVFATDPPQVHHFDTSRTLVQVLEFGNQIKQTRRDMEAYITARS